jgi:hypothetical protein
MPTYRVTVMPDERLIYWVKAASVEEAEQKAGELWSRDVEPDERDADGPSILAEEMPDEEDED